MVPASAELADGGLGAIHAVGVGETADQGARTPSQQHAQRAAQNADGHSDQAPADGRAPDHGVLALGQVQAAVGAALPDDGRVDSDPPLGGRSAQDAQRLVGIRGFLEADDDEIVCSHKSPIMFLLRTDTISVGAAADRRLSMQVETPMNALRGFRAARAAFGQTGLSADTRSPGHVTPAGPRARTS